MLEQDYDCSQSLMWWLAPWLPQSTCELPVQTAFLCQREMLWRSAGPVAWKWSPNGSSTEWDPCILAFWGPGWIWTEARWREERKKCSVPMGRGSGTSGHHALCRPLQLCFLAEQDRWEEVPFHLEESSSLPRQVPTLQGALGPLPNRFPHLQPFVIHIPQHGSLFLIWPKSHEPLDPNSATPPQPHCLHLTARFVPWTRLSSLKKPITNNQSTCPAVCAEQAQVWAWATVTNTTVVD